MKETVQGGSLADTRMERERKREGRGVVCQEGGRGTREEREEEERGGGRSEGGREKGSTQISHFKHLYLLQSSSTKR